MATRLLNGCYLTSQSCKAACVQQVQKRAQATAWLVLNRNAHSGNEHEKTSDGKSDRAQTYAVYASLAAAAGYFLWRETSTEDGLLYKRVHCLARREDVTHPSGWLPAYKSLVYGKSAGGYYDLPKVQPGEDVYSIARTFFADTKAELGKQSQPGSETYTRVASSQIPQSVPYVIVGAGTSGMSAARAIRASDPRAKVLLIGDERDAPYLRPPLSKQIWQRDAARVSRFLNAKGDYSAHSWFFFEPTSFFLTAGDLEHAEDGGIALLLDRSVTNVDAGKQTITLSSGEQIAYQHLLLATGGRPRTLAAFNSSDPNVRKRVSYFRTVQDFKLLHTLLSNGSQNGDKKQVTKTVAVVGGGFLGAELAHALKTAKLGDNVKLNLVCVFPENGFLEAMLPAPLSNFVTEQILKQNQKDAKVRVLPKHSIRASAYDASADKLLLETDSGELLAVDHAVVCVGLMPNTELAKSAHLETDAQFGGYVVNAELQAAKNIWVAGDAACFFDPLLGRRRVEHHMAAEQTGRIAGCNMVGEHRRFAMQPSFWCDVGSEVAIEAVGLTDARRYRTVTVALKQDGDKTDLSQASVVFYVDDADRLVGVLLWNLRNDFFEDDELYSPQRLNLARKLLEERVALKSESAFVDLAREFDLANSINDEFREIKQLVDQEKQSESEQKQDSSKRDKVMRKLEMLKAQSGKKEDQTDPFAIASK